MPRPAKTNESPNKQGDTPGKAAINGHTISIYGDYAIWDETAAKFITPEDLKRV
jgi:hypothetical protein